MKKDNIFLIYGGTGSLGKTLVGRLLTLGKIVYVFSRDEAKHHNLKLMYPKVNSIIGDIRDYQSVYNALKRTKPDVVINAAAIKQVPAAEDFIWEAVQTNINGAFNLSRALEQYDKKQLKVLSISTDKVAKPVNSYGMTKALQERIHLRAQDHTAHIHNCVRYGNVLESTGSVIPVFKQRLTEAKNLQITHKNMTRFLLSLDEAVDLIFQALEDIGGQKIFVPMVKSARIVDLAELMIKKHMPCDCDIKIEFTKIRPGEKLHEILISEEELLRTQQLKDKFVIHDIKYVNVFNEVKEEYSSGNIMNRMNSYDLEVFLTKHGVL